jgi:uncharacterized protein YndB with AHSA1/START domain
MKHEAKIITDLPNKKIQVIRAVDAPPEKVWRTFTEPGLLDQWWSPKPWTMETKILDLRPGGIWLFCMSGPEGNKFWWRVDYVAIDTHRSITTTGGPSDENANLIGGMPAMKRITAFTATPSGTEVSITIMFENEDDLHKMAGSGMLEGTAAVFNNLDELLGTVPIA